MKFWLILVITVSLGSFPVPLLAYAGLPYSPLSSIGSSNPAASTADLSVTTVATPDPVVAGKGLTFLVTVTNHGPSDATGVKLIDTLPEGMPFVFATPSQGICEEGDIVTCDLDTLANGASATVEIVVHLTTIGKNTNTASVEGNEADPELANNRATVATLVKESDVGDLIGEIILQARDYHNHGGTEITLFREGVPLEPMISPDGAFFFELEPGNYRLEAKHPGWLSQARTFFILKNFIDPGPIKLVAGDANADQRIDFQDMKLFQQRLGPALPGELTDINSDGRTDILDMAHAAMNQGQPRP